MLLLYLSLTIYASYILKVGHKNRHDVKTPLSLQDAISIVKDVFVTATERDIYTGDSVEIKIIQKSGITTEIFKLKND